MEKNNFFHRPHHSHNPKTFDGTIDGTFDGTFEATIDDTFDGTTIVRTHHNIRWYLIGIMI